jgi:hypothetical protein
VRGLPQQSLGGARSWLLTARGRLARVLWKGWEGNLDSSMWVVHLADKLLEVSREGLGGWGARVLLAVQGEVASAQSLPWP